MERPNNSFVIFQMGDGASDNIVLNLPAVLLSDSNATGGNISNLTTATTNNNASTVHATAGSPLSSNTRSSTANDNSSILSNPTQATNPSPDSTETTLQPNGDPFYGLDSNIQRNMLLSVSYVYSQGAPAWAANTGASNDWTSRSGSLILDVPDIPSNRNGPQFDAIVEFAASIALTAIASTGFRDQRGITKENFEKFPVKKKSELDDTTCPICFEEYDESKVAKEEDDKCNNVKRKREDDDNDTSRKMRKTERGKVPLSTEEEATSSSSTPSESPVSTQQPTGTSTEASNIPPPDPYNHEPIELTCHHRFGRSCAFEWLKSNNTCPLCRQVVHTDSTSANPPDRINLPNIGALLNPRSRDQPVVIFLDRSTNTLTTRTDTTTPHNSNERATPASTTPPSLPTRHPITSRLLQNLNRTSNLADSIFSTGVASRRTRDGVETVNLENLNNQGSTAVPPSGPDIFESFYEESRRLVQERLSMRNREPYGVMGFNGQGDVFAIRPHSQPINSNDNPTSATQASSASASNDTNNVPSESNEIRDNESNNHSNDDDH